MILQDSKAGCGPAALVNALESVGESITQTLAWAACRATGTHGVGSRNMVAGIAKLGHGALVMHHADPRRAIIDLRGNLIAGCPVLCVVDNGAHWVTVFGALHGRVAVADSADGGLVLCPTHKEFLSRWASHGVRKPYWAVAIAARGGVAP